MVYSSTGKTDDHPAGGVVHVCRCGDQFVANPGPCARVPRQSVGCAGEVNATAAEIGAQDPLHLPTCLATQRRLRCVILANNSEVKERGRPVLTL